MTFERHSESLTTVPTDGGYTTPYWWYRWSKIFTGRIPSPTL